MLSWLLHISPYSVRIRENADQNNSEYGHFLRSDSVHQKDGGDKIFKLEEERFRGSGEGEEQIRRNPYEGDSSKNFLSGY